MKRKNKQNKFVYTKYVVHRLVTARLIERTDGRTEGHLFLIITGSWHFRSLTHLVGNKANRTEEKRVKRGGQRRDELRMVVYELFFLFHQSPGTFLFLKPENPKKHSLMVGVYTS